MEEARRIEVPVDMPEGVSHEEVFGDDKSSLGNARARIAVQCRSRWQ
jgi:hypothetical protein